jgi:hypothetical protein
VSGSKVVSSTSLTGDKSCKRSISHSRAAIGKLELCR